MLRLLELTGSEIDHAQRVERFEMSGIVAQDLVKEPRGFRKPAGPIEALCLLQRKIGDGNVGHRARGR